MGKTFLLAALIPLLAGGVAPAAEPAREAGNVAQAQGRLAAGLLAAILSDEPVPNVAVSPATLAAALGAVALGASEEGKAAIAAGLGTGASADELAGLAGALAKAGQSPNASVTTALRIVFDDGLPLVPEAGALLKRYEIDEATADLAGAPAVDAINAWVKEKTGGVVDRILDSPLGGGGFVGLGALHFKAKWKTPFRLAEAAASFRRRDGSSADVPTMRLGPGNQQFRADDRFVAVDLPYADENYRMIVVAARDAAGIEAGDLAGLASWLAGAGFAEAKGEVSMPRFSLADGRDVAGAMAGVGLSPERLKLLTFPGFTRERVHVERILQKTAIEVDEEGTEAAAATAVIAERSIDPAFVSLVADAPFAFALRERRSGLVLAAGIVGDPSNMPDRSPR